MLWCSISPTNANLQVGTLGNGFQLSMARNVVGGYTHTFVYKCGNDVQIIESDSITATLTDKDACATGTLSPGVADPIVVNYNPALPSEDIAFNPETVFNNPDPVMCPIS